MFLAVRSRRGGQQGGDEETDDLTHGVPFFYLS
jgi:hypothetical protein